MGKAAAPNVLGFNKISSFVRRAKYYTSCTSGQKFIGRMMVFRRFVLYTLLGNEKDSSQAEGGVGLVISDSSEGGSKGSLVSSSEWTVKDVGSDSIDAIQVELSCSSGPLDITSVVSLYPLNMATAVIVKNNCRKDVTLTRATLRHLKFIRRAKAGIQGLRKCSY
ncbi:hypothetical protein NC651_030153 [Populus alba x Populus x berolinensis]|nr:hypothetical protein NC651_030153 [Populus alba x Populus x berolinensis]